MKKFLAVALISVLLAACGKSSGDQYVGTWKRVDGQGPNVTIAKHDNIFIVTELTPMMGGKLPKFSGQMVGDILVVQAYLPNERFIIDKTTGHLLRAGEELARANN